MKVLTDALAVIRFVAVLLCVFAPGRALAQTAIPGEADRQAILAVVQAFFDTMAAKDATTARQQILLPEGRFHAVGDQSGKAGKARIRTFTAEEYLFDLPAMKPRVRERMWNPDVRIRGSIANVWTPYNFLDGRKIEPLRNRLVRFDQDRPGMANFRRHLQHRSQV